MEAERACVLEVVCAVERTPHPRLHRSGWIDQPFFRCTLKRRAVKEALVEVLVPGVGVGVELDKRERAGDTSERP